MRTGYFMKYEAHFTPAKKEMPQSNYPMVSGQCEARHRSVVFSGFSGKFNEASFTI